MKHNVGWFDISVDEIVFLENKKSVDNLLKNLFEQSFWQILSHLVITIINKILKTSTIGQIQNESPVVLRFDLLNQLDHASSWILIFVKLKTFVSCQLS